MPLTLIKEDGSGMTDANSYADVADGDAYAEASLYATAWTGATADTKAAALVQATRLIDSEYQFNGYKLSQQQALQWPRVKVPDPDSDERSIVNYGYMLDGPFLPEGIVPKPVIDATCELATRMIKQDRTGDPGGGAGGIKSVDLAGAIGVEFFEGINPLPVIPEVVANMLWKYGTPVQSAGVVKLRRA